MSIDNDRDRVRLMIGDTDDSDPLLYDDEIEAFITQRQMLIDTTGTTTVTNLPAAAADCAAAIAAKFSRQFNFAEDGQRFDAAQRVGHYRSLEADLRRRQGGQAVQMGEET